MEAGWKQGVAGHLAMRSRHAGQGRFDLTPVLRVREARGLSLALPLGWSEAATGLGQPGSGQP